MSGPATLALAVSHVQPRIDRINAMRLNDSSAERLRKTTIENVQSHIHEADESVYSPGLGADWVQSLNQLETDLLARGATDAASKKFQLEFPEIGNSLEFDRMYAIVGAMFVVIILLIVGLAVSLYFNFKPKSSFDSGLPKITDSVYW